MNPHDEALAARARAVLAANWLGHCTKPAPHLYPHQWSWDSAFIAIGYAHTDQGRAQLELRSLFEGQWANGLLPHIVFNPEAGGYFPGPDAWGTVGNPLAPPAALAQTSGIVQPPIHATAALLLYRRAPDRERALAFLADLFPKLRAWHAYLYRERDPAGEGLVYIRHPWESGMDNSPLWDAALARIELDWDALPKLPRRDTAVVDAADRPTDVDYQRYMYLVRLFAGHAYDEARIRVDCPVLIQDVLFNALLCQAGQDLAQIARILGEDPIADEAPAARTAQALNHKLWDEEAGMYLNYDLVSGAATPARVAAGFAPLFAGAPDPHRAERLYAALNSDDFYRLGSDGYPVPSNSRQAADFSPNRYWRGPVWVNINWLLMHGLSRYGYAEYAERIRRATIGLVREHGCFEYFNPITGKGHGTDNFSWTAALLLDMLAEPA